MFLKYGTQDLQHFVYSPRSVLNVLLASSFESVTQSVSHIMSTKVFLLFFKKKCGSLMAGVGRRWDASTVFREVWRVALWRCSKVFLSCCRNLRNRCSKCVTRTVQYSTVQYSTVQYSTVQYSTSNQPARSSCVMCSCSWCAHQQGSASSSAIFRWLYRNTVVVTSVTMACTGIQL